MLIVLISPTVSQAGSVPVRLTIIKELGNNNITFRTHNVLTILVQKNSSFANAKYTKMLRHRKKDSTIQVEAMCCNSNNFTRIRNVLKTVCRQFTNMLNELELIRHRDHSYNILKIDVI